MADWTTPANTTEGELDVNPFLPKLNYSEHPTKKTKPWWVNDMDAGNMSSFAPGVYSSIKSANRPIPKGLTAQDMANMKSRIGAQNQLSTQNGLANMASQMGGTASPAFALSSARLQSGAGQAAAAKMADVNIDETRRNQDLEMARRGMQANAGKLALGAGQMRQDWWNSAQSQATAQDALNLQIAKMNAWTRRTNADMLVRPGDTPWGGIP